MTGSPFPPIDWSKPLKIVCHFPAGDRCSYCRDGVEHTHKRDRPQNDTEYAEWAGRNDH